MLTPKMQDALNKQINAELASSYLYLSMSAFFEAQSMTGMAKWMRVQASEELGHATKIFDYVNDRDGRVTLAGIDGPKVEWKSTQEAFEDAYRHEQKVTGLINDLMNLSAAEKDNATHDFLEWFIAEQVEEEATVKKIVDRLKLVGDSGLGQYMLDVELGQRGNASSGPTATPA